MSRLILGLDLGESSVGAALIKTNDRDELEQVIWANSRVFSGVVDAKSKVTLNSQRRGHRGQRKLIDRRVRRRKRVENELVRAGLLPKLEEARDVILGRTNAKADPKWLNPYELRTRAITEKLEPFEIGRALQHILQRRGFRSNRKAKLAELLGANSKFKDDAEIQAWIRATQELPDTAEAEEDTDSDKEKATKATSQQADTVNEEEDPGDDPTKTLKAIERLEHRWERSGLPTIGAYLSKELDEGKKVRKRNRISRVWLEDEFDAIWNFQSKYYPELLTDNNKNKIREAFEQRPLKAFRHVLPKRGWTGTDFRKTVRMTRSCNLLGLSKPVARNGHWVSHRFRIMETLMNLRVAQGNDTRPLSQTEVRKLADLMQETGSLSWPSVRKQLGLTGKDTKFTIESNIGSLKKLIGNLTERAFKQILGDRWDISLELSEEVERNQLQLMQDIETCDDPVKLFNLLQRPKQNQNRIYPLTKREAFEVIKESFASNTLNYSVRAMRLMLREMMAGKLPHEARAAANTVEKAKQKLNHLPAPPPLRNPRVHRCLIEVQRVVNAVIDCYGLPDVIKIEMARDMSKSKKDKDAISKAISDNAAKNKVARDWFKANNVTEPSRPDLDRHKLWVQQKLTCPYCLQIISSTDLINGSAEIDHVLPLEQSGDDSFGNKVLAHSGCNREKSDSLPFDIWGHDAQAWDDRKSFVKSIGNRKLMRHFEKEEIPEDFAAHQLKDTESITKEAVKYLQQLNLKGIPWGAEPLTIWSTNGKATGVLRKLWDLNQLLPPLATNKKVPDGHKNRLDHRHHAIDAIVIALTTPSRFVTALQITRGNDEEIARFKKSLYTPPKAEIKRVIVAAQTSHALNKGIRGALHDATFYGRKDIGGKTIFVKRVTIESFYKQGKKIRTFDEVIKKVTDSVYDADLKRAMLARLKQGDWSSAFKKSSGGQLPVLLDGRGNPFFVESVRIKYSKLTAESAHEIPSCIKKRRNTKFVAPESNHHSEVVRLASGKLEQRVVTMITAANAMRENKSPYGLTIQGLEKIVVCLCEDEIVEYEGIPMRVAATGIDGIVLRYLNDATSGIDGNRIRIRSESALHQLGTKYRIDVMGNLTPTNEQ